MSSYKNPTLLGGLLALMLLIFLLLDVLGISEMIARWETLEQIAASQASDYEKYQAGTSPDTVQEVSYPLVVLGLATGLLFFFWTYRIVKNAWALSPEPLRFSPGWAVGFYFIPIINLWKPFGAIKEALTVFETGQDRLPSYGIIRFWWALWLISILSGDISEMDPVNGSHLLNTIIFWSICALPIANFLSALAMVITVTKSCKDCYEMAAGQEPTPQILNPPGQ